MTETQMPPQSIAYDGRITNPVKCVVCRGVIENPQHDAAWWPENPPGADGYQRSACWPCFNRLSGRRTAPPPAVVRAAEEAIDGRA